MRDINIAISNVSYLSVDGSGLDTFYQQINEGTKHTEIENYDPDGHLGKKGLRYVSSASKMYCNLAFNCLQHPNVQTFLNQHPERFGLYDGSELANLEEAMVFDLVAKGDGPDYVSPMKTPNTLANASASLMAIKAGITGPNFSVCGGATGSMQALDIACMHIRNRITEYGIVVSTEATSKFHQALRTGLQYSTADFYAKPFGVGLTLTTKEQAKSNKEPILGQIRKVVSGQSMDTESNSDTMARLIESVFEDRYRPKDIDAIILTGAHNMDFRGFVDELWWNLEIEHARVYCPEEIFGVCESSGGSVGILYAMGLANGKIPGKQSEKNQNYLVCSMDKLGYGMVSLVRI